MEYPRISIVTPSFNQGKYIEQTITSILDQNYPNLEYIIIDGGSTDETLDIIKKYEKQINYWVSERDAGQSDAIRKGFLLSSGQIFNWINSDDYLEPDSLFKVADAFKKDIDIFCGYTRIFDDKSNDTIQIHRTGLSSVLEKTFVDQIINQPAMFYKKSVVQVLGGINVSLHYVMDLELWWRYLVRFGQSNIQLSDEIIANFRLHDLSKTVTNDLRFREEERSVLHFLLCQLKLKKSCSDYFKGNSRYFSHKWETDRINSKSLKTYLAQKYFYDAYNMKNLEFCKFALKQLLSEGMMVFNFQSIAMLGKIYIGDIPFRKLLTRNA